MYETHFGLKTKPFGSKAEGAAVFVGPQQAKLIASLQKGIGAPDAIVTVTGPVGVGKSTIVDRALETLPTGRTAARIGRMHLTQDEVVDLLMGGFGIKKTTGGCIRRFAAFRRILQQQRESGIPVAIVIEDAHRLGNDALAEVEALTAADAGDAGSANIILMGQPGLHDLLATPHLARLKQRIRLRLGAEPLSSAEVQGYLKHSIREAGGDYDSIFDAGVAEVVFGCSEGIPRVINTLCETALTTAMEDNSARVTVTLMKQIASDAFGFEAASVETATAPPAAAAAVSTDEDIDWEQPPRPEIATEDEPEIEAVANEDVFGHDIIVESGCYPIPLQPASPDATDSVRESDSEVAVVDTDDTNVIPIPELFDDTQPELPELSSLSVADHADIPVLDTPAGETNEELADDSSIESAQTLAQPTGLANDEAVNVAPPAEAATPGAKPENAASDDNFDLDAALSPEVESTNVMPGITPNLDVLANQKIEATAVQETINPASQPQPEPEPKSGSTPKPESEPEPNPEDAPAALNVPADIDPPTLSDSMRVDVDKEVKRANEIEAPAPPAVEQAPASDSTRNAPAMRDPLATAEPANRKSDIDALEAALAAAKNGELASQAALPAIPNVNGAAPQLQAKNSPASVPEISLDKVISDQQDQNAQLDKFRDEIGNANSLEDISDVMAETLFGVEFDEVAAAAMAKGPEAQESSHDETAESPVTLTNDEMPGEANDADEPELEQKQTVGTAVVDAASDKPDPLNDSAALRIDMLNEMKLKAASMAENVEMGSDDPAKNSRGATGPQPEPIERQINTSMTQTLEALNVAQAAKAAENEDEPKEEKKSGGLFSRFRKSS